MQHEESNPVVYEQELIRPVMKKKPDPLLGFLFAQITICGVALLAALVLRLIGGEVYQTVVGQYREWYCDPTRLSLITREEQLPILYDSATDVVEENKITVSPSDVGYGQGGGDWEDDSKALWETDESVLSTSLYRDDSVNAMAIPVAGKITSPFGYRQHPIYGKRLFHNGVDIGAEEGTEIVAALSGTVKEAGAEETFGNYVILSHGNDLFTVYAHCKTLLVKKGQSVEKGEAIALVGSTGVSTGPHLHFEVRWGEYRLDPAVLVDFS